MGLCDLSAKICATILSCEGRGQTMKVAMSNDSKFSASSRSLGAGDAANSGKLRAIAIDGPVASGKGTIGRRLAQSLGFAYLDTGSLYRGLGAIALEQGIDLTDKTSVESLARSSKADDFKRDDLRKEAVGEAASIVAAMPRVRQALVALQRRFAEAPPSGFSGVILDGRDIGTVILPDAALKLFVTASPEARAMRRFLELQNRGDSATYARVLSDLQARDERDRSRTTAPLKPADDAILLDTSEMDADQVFERAFDLASQTFGA